MEAARQKEMLTSIRQFLMECVVAVGGVEDLSGGDPPVIVGIVIREPVERFLVFTPNVAACIAENADRVGKQFLLSAVALIHA